MAVLRMLASVLF